MPGRGKSFFFSIAHNLPGTLPSHMHMVETIRLGRITFFEIFFKNLKFSKIDQKLERILVSILQQDPKPNFFLLPGPDS